MPADPVNDYDGNCYRYDATPSPYPYDPSSPSLVSAVVPMGRAPCYPWITYDPGPRPEACDEPHVIIQARTAEGG